MYVSTGDLNERFTCTIATLDRAEFCYVPVRIRSTADVQSMPLDHILRG